MRLETSALLGGLPVSTGRLSLDHDERADSYSAGVAWKTKFLVALFGTAALLAAMSSISPSASASSNVKSSSSNTNTHNWDAKKYEAFESALFQKSLAMEGRSKHHEQHEQHKHEGFVATESTDTLIYFNHTSAFDMLQTNHKSTSQDFFYYQQGWDAQINQAYCPVASSAAVMNSLKGKIALPQDPIYVPFPWATQTALIDNQCVRETLYDVDKMQHIFFGMGLDMAEQLLNCHLAEQGYVAKAHHVDPTITSAKEVRKAIVNALQSENSRVVINYDRGGIGQGDFGHGHFSPIGAYNVEYDAFLVMDVAKYKYPLVWVPLSQLMGGIGTMDHCANFVYPDAPPDTSSMQKVAQEIGCQPAYRGYMIIEEAKD